MSGLLSGSSFVLATGLVTGNTTLFLNAAMTMSVVVPGRWLGIAVDGFDFLKKYFADFVIISFNDKETPHTIKDDSTRLVKTGR